MSTATTQAMMRSMVRGVYDIQKQRIQFGNRIVAAFKSKLGIKPGKKEDEDKEAANVLGDLRKSYEKITEAIVAENRKMTKKNFRGDQIISDYIEFCLVDQYIQLEESEKRHFKDIEKSLEDIPVWNKFLKDVKGCGPAMAGVIISEINIHESKYPSSLHVYAGLDVDLNDGRGRGRHKEHLVKREYIDKDGNLKERDSITFNPFLKTKLVGVLASSFVKCKGSKYREVYDGYKHRISNMDVHKGKSKGHINNMALRYVVKIFLIDLYVAWRALEGLEVHPPYHEAKLGHRHAS